MLKYNFKMRIRLKAGGRIGSFGFASVSACELVKTKCANVGWHFPLFCLVAAKTPLFFSACC
jgi:hypothetical protein